MLSDSSLSSTGSYIITEPIGAVPAVVSLVTPEGVASPTYVDLTLVSEMTDGEIYEIDVSGLLKDSIGNQINQGSKPTSGQFAGVGQKPQLVSIEIYDVGRRVRFNFSEPMQRIGSLSALTSYTFNTLTAGAAEVFVSSVVPPSSPPASPSYVDVFCSEMTIGANYEAEVSITGPVDLANNTMDPANRILAFVGVGINPTIERIRAVSQNRVDVEFSENMLNNADAFDETRYTWDNGLQTISVLNVSENIVKLVTSDQDPNTLYNLTIDPT
jgi:hypothetical protein